MLSNWMTGGEQRFTKKESVSSYGRYWRGIVIAREIVEVGATVFACG